MQHFIRVFHVCQITCLSHPGLCLWNLLSYYEGDMVTLYILIKLRRGGRIQSLLAGIEPGTFISMAGLLSGLLSRR